MEGGDFLALLLIRVFLWEKQPRILQQGKTRKFWGTINKEVGRV